MLSSAKQYHFVKLGDYKINGTPMPTFDIGNAPLQAEDFPYLVEAAYSIGYNGPYDNHERFYEKYHRNAMPNPNKQILRDVIRWLSPNDELLDIRYQRFDLEHNANIGGMKTDWVDMSWPIGQVKPLEQHFTIVKRLANSHFSKYAFKQKLPRISDLNDTRHFDGRWLRKLYKWFMTRRLSNNHIWYWYYGIDDSSLIDGFYFDCNVTGTSHYDQGSEYYKSVTYSAPKTLYFTKHSDWYGIWTPGASGVDTYPELGFIGTAYSYAFHYKWDKEAEREYVVVGVHNVTNTKMTFTLPYPANNVYGTFLDEVNYIVSSDTNGVKMRLCTVKANKVDRVGCVWEFRGMTDRSRAESILNGIGRPVYQPGQVLYGSHDYSSITSELIWLHTDIEWPFYVKNAILG